MASALPAAASRAEESISSRASRSQKAVCISIGGSGTFNLASLAFDIPGIDDALPLASLWMSGRHVGKFIKQLKNSGR